MDEVLAKKINGKIEAGLKREGIENFLLVWVVDEQVCFASAGDRLTMAQGVAGAAVYNSNFRSLLVDSLSMVEQCEEAERGEYLH